jgi:hypothetical protein
MKKNNWKTTKAIKLAMVAILICLMGILLSRTDRSFAVSAKDSKKQTVAPSSTQKPGTSSPSPKSSKVNQLLQQLMQAQSLKQYNDLLKNTSLSPSEQDDLKKELAKPQYASKRERLFKDAKTSAEANARSKANQKKQEIARKQQQNLSQLNQQANEQYQRHLAKAPGAAQARVPEASTFTVGPSVKTPSTLEGLPHITSVSSPITPGRDNLGIVGENFRKPGEEMGTVSLKIGDISTDLPIISYSSIAIQARVPAEINDIARQDIPSVLEGGIIEGRIGVHTPRGTSVAVVQLNIPIDESLLDPKIFSIFPKEIQPGQRVSIFGEKFLSREQGTVRFHFGSRTIDATIIDWAPIGILVELPADISGMQRTMGTVEVENYVGRSDRCVTQLVTFIPVEVTEELANALDHNCGHSSWSGTELFFDFNLANSWRVVDRNLLDLSVGRAYCGNVRQPELGSTNPRYEVRGVCSSSSGFGGDECYCLVHVIIQGPRGLEYR